MQHPNTGPSRRLLLAGAAALAAPGVASAAASPGGLIDAFIRERMIAKGVPGAGVAVVRAGKVLKRAGYGRASIEFDVAASERTVFPMASSSKMLAGLTAARLVESGKLSFDASIRDYLPEVPVAWGAVRIWHLLSHTSGLGGPGGNPEYVAEAAKRKDEETYVDPLKLESFTPAELIAYAAAAPVVGPPGEEWRYAQFPYFLFGEIVRRLTGGAYHDYVMREILTPLGMADSHYGDHRTLVPGRNSTNYTRQFGPLQNFALEYTPGYWTAAGLNASAADMVRFFDAFQPGRLVSQASLDRLFAPVVLGDGKPFLYGLGFDLNDAGGRQSAGHEGGGCCYVRWWPAERLGIAIMLNLSGSREDGVELKLEERLLEGSA